MDGEEYSLTVTIPVLIDVHLFIPRTLFQYNQTSSFIRFSSYIYHVYIIHSVFSWNNSFDNQRDI